MLKKSLFAAVLTFSSGAVIAENIVVGGDYISIGGLTAIAGSGGYKIPLGQENATLLVGGRYGMGFGDDNGLELDSLVGAFAKYQYSLNEQWYVQGIAAYTKFEYSFDFDYLGSNYGFSGSDSEFSIGVGGGYKLSDSSAIELTFENFDYDSALSIGYRYEL